MTNVCNILFLIETRCERSELSTHTQTHTHTGNRAFWAFLPTRKLYVSRSISREVERLFLFEKLNLLFN